MKRCMLLSMVIAIAGLAGIASAGELKIGDKAPELQVDKWVQGDGFQLAKVKGKELVVVEFWATWCSPCIASIPHLTHIQKDYGKKGVRVVGVTKYDEGNTLEQVEALVKKMSKEIGYSIAFEKAGKTYEAFMDGTNQAGIPTAFIIDKQGRIAWIGHPMDGMDEALDQMLAGKYDLEKTKKVFALSQKVESLMMEGDSKKVLPVLNEILEADPAHLVAIQTKFYIYATEIKDHARANAIGERAYEIMKDNAGGLNDFSWMLLTDETMFGKYDKLALKAAEQCNKLTNNENWMFLDTLALAKFKNGARAEAIEIEKKAIKLCDDPRVKQQLEETLKSFQ